MSSSLRKAINYLTDQNSWQELDNTYAVAEITVPLQSWERSRRFVFIREIAETVSKGSQTAFEFKDAYDY
ncbi:MAG: hypothetical protein PHT62_11275 [Desulfotomaculaceae bacterium]|nr:hypothetical protein [Desulfotomaculaceae bacterium]